MKTSELATTMLDMTNNIEDSITNAKKLLDGEFVATSTNNEQSSNEAFMQTLMTDYLIYSGLASKYKKLVDTTKKALDSTVEELGTPSNGAPGTTVNLHESNTFRFSKRQNADGNSTLVTDLLTALARVGVDKTLVDEAVRNATKKKRGNVYYEVTVVED